MVTVYASPRHLQTTQTLSGSQAASPDNCDPNTDGPVGTHRTAQVLQNDGTSHGWVARYNHTQWQPRSALRVSKPRQGAMHAAPSLTVQPCAQTPLTLACARQQTDTSQPCRLAPCCGSTRTRAPGRRVFPALPWQGHRHGQHAVPTLCCRLPCSNPQPCLHSAMQRSSPNTLCNALLRLVRYAGHVLGRRHGPAACAKPHQHYNVR